MYRTIVLLVGLLDWRMLDCVLIYQLNLVVVNEM